MNKFLKRNLLGMPMICAIGILGVMLISILVGSFLDFDIDAALYNKTVIGDHFATYGSIISYCLYPAAGMCLFKALKKKGGNYVFLAWVLLVISVFVAAYSSDNYNGDKLRKVLGDFTGAWFVSVLIWVLIYAWVPVACYFIIDDTHPERLIMVGATILVAGVISDWANSWLKLLASRPRYYYLLEQFPGHEREHFRNWWEWLPYTAGKEDGLKSWPSINMTIATMAFMYPSLVSNFKKTNKMVEYIVFGFACAYVLLYGFNRIHMGKHSLTDVAFGALFTYIVFAFVYQGFDLSLKRANK
ncbi:MAG: phosphatase PAP2 family protein [Bacilli bacterium]|nr:phosphatase PAP2 family protein [Bacilli bacterium]